MLKFCAYILYNLLWVESHEVSPEVVFPNSLYQRDAWLSTQMKRTQIKTLLERSSDELHRQASKKSLQAWWRGRLSSLVETSSPCEGGWRKVRDKLRACLRVCWRRALDNKTSRRFQTLRDVFSLRRFFTSLCFNHPLDFLQDRL